MVLASPEHNVTKHKDDVRPGEKEEDDEIPSRPGPLIHWPKPSVERYDRHDRQLESRENVLMGGKKASWSRCGEEMLMNDDRDGVAPRGPPPQNPAGGMHLDELEP